MRALLAFLALLLPFSLRASEREPLIVQVWESENGLPGNVVRSIAQTTDGYIWIATAEGIARFDGVEFELVDTGAELLRLRFAIWRLFALPDGSLWVSTFQGRLFRVLDNRLQAVEEPEFAVRPPLTGQVLVDAAGTLHFKRGDDIWKVVDYRATKVPAPSPDLLDLFARDLARQADGGRIALPATTPELLCRNGDRWAVEPAGFLAVTGPDGKSLPVDIPGLSPPYAISELLEDREGNVWIATPLNGVVRVRRGRVKVLATAEGLSERAVYTFLQHSSGEWWIAGRRGGVDRWTKDSTEYLDLVPTGNRRAVASLFEDRDRRLWVASRGGSVFLYRDGIFEPQFSKSQIPSKVRAISQDADGVMWFGGEQGIASYDGMTVRAYGPADGLPECDVTVLARDPEGRIVAGTSDGRIFRGDSRGFVEIPHHGLIRHWWISGLLPGASGELWVTTLGGGLLLWNGSHWQRFGTDDGLPDLRLTCILDDTKGHLWFGSVGGIIRGNRDELLAHAAHPDKSLHWQRFDRSDGLPTRECVGGYQPAGWRANDGELWFPTASGVVRVQPDRIQVNRAPPPVYLRSTRVDGRQQDEVDGRVEAGPGRSRLEFRFVGLSYSSPEKVTYRARLLGLDEDWRELGNQRVAAFEAVPPGRYTFEVLAVNGDGTESSEPARVTVQVRAQFWQTGWFLLALTGFILACAAATGWGVARARLKRRIQGLKVRHAREAERARIARDLHDDLGASLTEISILSALAAEGGEESNMRPALDQLSAKAKSVVGTLDEIVWAVNPREDTLRSLIDYLAAFAREFLDTASIALRTDIPRGIPDLPLDTNVRHGVFLAAREALNNLVKHSKATHARLSVELPPQGLRIQIEDNGRGFSQEWEAKGYGLANLRERMKACGGDCSISSIPGGGVTVVLTLPSVVAPSTPN